MNELSIGEKIGEGAGSEVFLWGDGDKVIKLAKHPWLADALMRELSNTRAAYELSLPVPQPYEFLEVDGRPGIVFERIRGQSIKERFLKAAVTDELQQQQSDAETENLRMTATLLSMIHRHSVANLPSQREMMKTSIGQAPYLTQAEKERIIERLDGLPQKQQLCHGDPNPGNILIRGNQAVMIDWMDAAIGNPEADLAEYVIMMRFAVLPSDVPMKAVRIFDSMREAIIHANCQEYERLTGIAYRDIDAWILPVAAAKLCSGGVGEAEKQLIVHEVRTRLQGLTSQPS